MTKEDEPHQLAFQVMLLPRTLTFPVPGQQTAGTWLGRSRTQPSGVEGQNATAQTVGKKPDCFLEWQAPGWPTSLTAEQPHLISSAEKLTMVGMKFSRMMMERICFQSVVLSPSSRQMDSSASFTAAGGLAMDRTSTRCCFFMDFTAVQWEGETARL